MPRQSIEHPRGVDRIRTVVEGEADGPARGRTAEQEQAVGGERSQRGYGVEAIERFLEEVAFVEFGGPSAQRSERLQQVNALSYNDVRADRNTVALVQALEAILHHHALGKPDGVVEVNSPQGGLVLRLPGTQEALVLYAPRV